MRADHDRVHQLARRGRVAQSAKKPTAHFSLSRISSPKSIPSRRSCSAPILQVMADAARVCQDLGLRHRRHQLRLPGQQGGEVQRRLRAAARPAAGGRDPAQGARGHLHSAHDEVPRGLERSGTGGGPDGAAGRRLRTAGRRAASAHARAGLQRQGRLDAHRGGKGRGARFR